MILVAILLGISIYFGYRIYRSNLKAPIRSLILLSDVCWIAFFLIYVSDISFVRNGPLTGSYHSSYNKCMDEGQSISPKLELLANGKFRSNIAVKMWDTSMTFDSGIYAVDFLKKNEEISLIMPDKKTSISYEKSLFSYSLKMFCGDPDGPKYIRLTK